MIAKPRSSSDKLTSARTSVTTLCLIACLGLSPVGTHAVAQDALESSAQGDASPQIIGEFVKEHCVRCHDAQEQNADRRFDTLAPAIDDDNSLVDYQDILDQINLGAMPPEDEPQPSDESRRAVVAWLTDAIADFHAKHQVTAQVTKLRRLNAREYRNTIRDLLQLNMEMFDPTTYFPRDQTSENFDNVGSALVTSGFLLERYLDAADQCIEKILALTEKPTKQTWHFKDKFNQQPEIDQVHRKTNGFSHLTLYDVIGADKHEGAYAPIHAFDQGVPHDGYYEIRFLAEALNRDNPYDDEFLGTDRREPLRIGIVAGNKEAGPLHKPQPTEPLLAELDLADESRWYSSRVWLDKGYTPRFTFRNGLMDARELWSKLIKRYPKKFPDPTVTGIVARRFNAIKFGKLPHIRIHEVIIEGPFYETWPTRSHHALLGDKCEQILASERFDSQQELTALVARFVSAAYRRPATEAEIARVLSIVDRRRSEGRNELQAYADGLKMALCSPSFLYLQQPPEYSQFALASQLAYFLWSSAPDEELLAAAESGKLQSDEGLRHQVERMVADPKSVALVSGFLDSWLNLRDLGSTPPDRGQFRSFYHYDLGTAMRRETELFAQHLLKNNLSVDNFIDSNFTFANRKLAQHYGYDLPHNNDFQMVVFNDDRRGGLLGQASVLTVSANGIDTSPVVRGVWILENFLDTPPSSPPPDVEPLDPDTRGATSIRDQLRKHRESTSCNDCHRKIDPLGFALENFDPIGAWRDKYNPKIAIDASGALSGGRTFEDIRQFKQHLLADKALFYHGITKKLMAYAVGRLTGPHDRPEIDRIVQSLESKDFGFRDLVIEVAASKTFAGVVEASPSSKLSAIEPGK